MNACIAILAHEKAAPTIADFQPRWETLGLPIIAFVPEGDKWPGAPVSRVVSHGQSAHKGLPVYERFIHCCETLLGTDFDYFMIMEYDTVNLSSKAPEFNAGAVNFATMWAFGAGAQAGQMLALSPWVMTRPILAAFIEALKMQLRKPERVEWVDGLLDRWIAVAVMTSLMPWEALRNCVPWCDDRWDMMTWIEKEKAGMVHGFKSKEKFQHLWPKQ